MFAILVMNASLSISYNMPILRCGVITETNKVRQLIIPGWVWGLVVLYCAECIYLFLNHLYVAQDIKQRSGDKHTPYFTGIRALSITLFQFNAEFVEFPFFKHFMGVIWFLYCLDSFDERHKTGKFNPTSWASRIVSRGMCFVFVLSNLGVFQILPSVNARLWSIVIHEVGRAHLEVFGHFVVFRIIDVIYRDPR